MTKPLSFTKAGLKRRIDAARESGLHIVGIQSDGTILVSESLVPPPAVNDNFRVPVANNDEIPAADPRWSDVQA